MNENVNIVDDQPVVDEVNIDEVDYILPEGYEEETEEEQEESTEEVEKPEDDSTEEAKEETKEETKEEFSWDNLDIKFLKEQKKLSDFTPEEVQAYVQKGMNSDRLLEKLNNYESQINELQGSQDISLGRDIAELAKQSGYTPAEYIEAIRNQMFENKAAANGTSADFERKEYEQSVKDQQIAAREQKITEAEEVKRTKAQEDNMYTKFIDTFPDVKNEQISQETWDRVKGGMDLTEAYNLQLTHEKDNTINELMSKLKQQEQNYKNVQSAPVTGTTNNGTGEQVDDDFMAGFNSR